MLVQKAMMQTNHQYGPVPSQEEEDAAYLQALQNQHATMLDDLVAMHMLWSPELFYPTITSIGVIRTVIRLNDGRECEVVTSSVSGETTATVWSKQ